MTQDTSTSIFIDDSLSRRLNTLAKVVKKRPCGCSYLFLGQLGDYRLTIAKNFAMSILCEKNGCGKCPTCRMVTADTHPDISVVSPLEGKASMPVDAVRRLAEDSYTPPIISTKKIIIITNASVQTLGQAGANALLKPIEEPSNQTVWLLCADSNVDVLSTISSRCVKITLNTPGNEALRKYLQNTKHEHGLSEENIERVISICGHDIGLANYFANNISAVQTCEEILSYVVVEKDPFLIANKWYNTAELEQKANNTYPQSVKLIIERYLNVFALTLTDHHQLQAIFTAKNMILANVQPLLALEAMFIEIKNAG